MAPWQLLERFWLRDYRSDVEQLNVSTAKGGKSAGFEPAPPSVLTGNPDRLLKGECLMVLGINPAWSDSRKFYADDVAPSISAHDAGDFQTYRARRARYFAGGPEYNGRHFTRLGTALRGGFTPEGLPNEGRTELAKKFFHDHVFMADLFPWWSRNISRINVAALASVPFYREWKEILLAWIGTLQPIAIVVNTSGQHQREAVQSLLGVDAQPFGSAPVAYSGRADGIPLLVHPQLNGCREMTHQRYQAMVGEWRESTASELLVQCRRTSRADSILR